VRFAVIAVLLAFLAGAIFVGHYGWVSAGNVTMPAWGWLMMGLGIFFTLAIGGGLMVLIFYSSRQATMRRRKSSTMTRLKTDRSPSLQRVHGPCCR
jgi:uncharacterized membrane protein YphA (DoxX/SURF4 family)